MLLVKLVRLRIYMPEASPAMCKAPNEENRYQAAAVRVAYWDVLQREPTHNECRERSHGTMPSAESVIGLYKELLCSSESIRRYALEMPPLLLARVTINQLFGRAPTSVDEINELAGKIVQAGWLAFVQHVLLQAEVRNRIFIEIQRLAQHGLWAADSEDAHRRLLVEPVSPLAAPAPFSRPAVAGSKKAGREKRRAVGATARAGGEARGLPPRKADVPGEMAAGKERTKPAGRAGKRH